ncbi:MAG: hypothetical protein K1X88_24640 [Nannocystaceae bacterium]|nr:hypothetical protein [Nannocystaceae bacterium]
MRPTTRCSVALPLTLSFLVTTIPGCSKIEELTGKKDETVAKTDEKSEAKTDEKKAEEKKADEKKEEAKVEAAPIPVAPMLTGLDAMLAFVPDDKAEFVIVRDASVFAEYAEEGAKFFEGPLTALGADGGALPGDLAQAKAGLDVAKVKMAEIVTAVAASGFRPQEGGAMIKLASGKSLIVFAADKPTAVVDLAKALGGGDKMTATCKAIDGHAGWNVCTDDQATADGYKPAADPAPVRKVLSDELPGVDLDESNVLAHVSADGKPLSFAVATLPGLVHLAMGLPDSPDVAPMKAALAPGAAPTLSQVQAGAGFAWMRVNPEMIKSAMKDGMNGAPPQVVSMFDSLTGEFVVAGEVSPGGLFIQAGASDTAGMGALYDEALKDPSKLPATIPDLKDSKVTWEKTQIQAAGATVDAFHVAITGVKEADVLKAYAGLSPDFWTFAHDNMLTFAAGPDAANVGKMVEAGGAGPSADLLASLPHQLADALPKNEVSMVVHLPVDALQGASMRKVVDAALKTSTELKPAQINAVLGFLAPLSSATFWVAQPSGTTIPVVHLAVQGIGNRATDEGKAALEAARKVAAGGDPATEFGTLASSYGSSPMAFAYHARAGDQGPGALVGSGTGAVALMGAIGFAIATGASNPTLADDLGVKPEEPPPPLEIPTKPVTPKHEPDPKKPTPKKDPKKPDPAKPDPAKPDPVKPDPKKPDPAKPDPAKPDPKKPVEPPKPDPKKPPKPTPDPKKPDPKKPFRPVRPGSKG